MLLLTAVLTLGVVPAAADDDARLRASPPVQRSPAQRSPAAGLEGVVTNGTTSLAGQAFYRHFCAHWYDKPLNEMFAIAIRERASARRGSQVAVEYAGRIVFQGALPPTPGAVRAVSQQAVEISYESVVNAEVQRLLFSQDELAPDEI